MTVATNLIATILIHDLAANRGSIRLQMGSGTTPLLFRLLLQARVMRAILIPLLSVVLTQVLSAIHSDFLLPQIQIARGTTFLTYRLQLPAKQAARVVIRTRVL